MIQESQRGKVTSPGREKHKLKVINNCVKVLPPNTIKSITMETLVSLELFG